MPVHEAAVAAVTVAIPTYRRERVLVETIRLLLALPVRAVEIIVVDQTESHEEATRQALASFESAGQIRWIRLAAPSIPRAMNRALLEAGQPVVLFVDDDVRPEPQLVAAHVRAHERHPGALIAGRVIQPWQEGVDFSGDAEFHFASTRAQPATEFIGCNFSVGREAALRAGGFDENFVRVAYRFEAEFALRFLAQGHTLRFEPDACLHHLKVREGGTRTFGEHLTTWKPDHAVGAYYFSLRTGRWGEFLRRPIRALATRHHLRHPWQMPATLIGELAGMWWAWRLHRGGPRYARQRQT